MKKYRNNDKIFTKHFRMSLNSEVHDMNLLSVVIGGPGTWKSWSFVKPNLLQANTSYVVLDPKGELLRDCGAFLQDQGYQLKVLDLREMWKSHGYNPLAYVHDDNDIQRLATNLIKSTNGRNATVGGDMKFWDDKAEELLMAFLLLVYYSYPKEEMNFPTVMDLLRMAAIQDENNPHSELDDVIDQLMDEEPDHPAIRYFGAYRLGAVKTKQSIQSTLSSHLTKFNLGSVINLTSKDELELETMGEQKTALFCVIPHNDKSFNFLVSVLYMQLFQLLMNSADTKYDGKLPIPVHFLMDEFANVAIPDDFRNILSTMRSYRIMVSIIVQNLTDLKTIFKDEWESIVGDCDTLLYLGGRENEVHEYISKCIGEETIDTASYGQSRGRNGSSSSNQQSTGRRLVQAAEIGRIKKYECILLIKGEYPIRDRKYNIKNHPNYKFESHGKEGRAYRHGTIEQAVATIDFVEMKTFTDTGLEYVEIDEEKEEQEIILVSPEELDDFLYITGGKQNEQAA